MHPRIDGNFYNRSKPELIQLGFSEELITKLFQSTDMASIHVVVQCAAQLRTLNISPIQIISIAEFADSARTINTLLHYFNSLEALGFSVEQLASATSAKKGRA